MENRMEKLQRLQEALHSYKSVIVAFSGGVDSSLLLALGVEALGSERVLAVTAQSPLIPGEEIAAAGLIADQLGARHLIIPGGELEIEAIASNPVDRCYYCKASKLTKLVQLAAEQGFDYVLEGSNQSDTGDYRPGLRALQEFERVKSPFIEYQFSKEDIRALARAQGLPNWDKAAQACLASRIPYGVRIDAGILERIARAESGLHRLGLANLRVRYHGDLARIEIEAPQFELLAEPARREPIVALVQACGFTYVTLDLQGYRTGSLNEGAGLKGDDRG